MAVMQNSGHQNDLYPIGLYGLERKAIQLVPSKQHEQGGWCWVTYKDVIAMPCIVDGSCISMFPYTTSYTCVVSCFITYIKVNEISKQDVWISSYRHMYPV